MRTPLYFLGFVAALSMIGIGGWQMFRRSMNQREQQKSEQRIAEVKSKMAELEAIALKPYQPSAQEVENHARRNIRGALVDLSVALKLPEDGHELPMLSLRLTHFMQAVESVPWPSDWRGVVFDADDAHLARTRLDNLSRSFDQGQDAGVTELAREIVEEAQARLKASVVFAAN